MAASQLLKTRIRSGAPNLPEIYDGPVISLTEIRDEFSAFPGGSVDLECRTDGIAIVTLNNPAKRNALTGTMMGDLLDVVTKLENWSEGKGLILKGAGGNFCSGGDLALARATGNAAAGHRMATLMDNILTRLQAMPVVSVALIEGCGALGGGAEVAIGCDFRLASPSSQGIGFVHGRMAILPAWGGTGRLVAAVGYRKALDLLTTARVCRPDDAFNIGLVDEVLEDGDSEKLALNWLKARTGLSSQVVRGIKSSVVISRCDPDVSDLEKRIFAPFWGSEGNKAALAANLKHRAK